MQQRYRSLQPLIQWQQKERPIAWERIFARRAPLVLELGCGNGEYLVRQATQFPERNFIGIDQEWTAARRVLRRAHAQRLANVRVLYGEARVILERGFVPESLSEAYALFPCPWPKTAHARHRLFSQAFLRLLNSRLAADAPMRILTDEPAFRDWILERSQDTGFAITSSDIPSQAITLYARRWQEQGQKLFYELRFQKTQHWDVPLKEDAAINTHRTEHFNPDNFHPHDTHEPFPIEFKDYLYDPKRQKAMLRVIVVEESLVQDLWIEITRTEQNWHIRPSWGCRIIPTIGIQQALDLVLECVLASTSQPTQTASRQG